MCVSVNIFKLETRNGSRSITSVGEERANLSAVVYL